MIDLVRRPEGATVTERVAAIGWLPRTIRAAITGLRKREWAVAELLGYWNRPEETARAFTADGWFRTGDIGRRDGDGFVTLVDRRKDMFISGGENVFPVEVEMALLDHPDIAEAAVISVAERWGEVGRAFVVVKPDRVLDPAAVMSHCAARVARYKVPKEIVLAKKLPRTASGKMQKHLLRAQIK